MKQNILLLYAVRASGYWLMGANNILTTQRIDPIVNPGTVGTHVHSVLGGSNFGLNVSTAQLQASECTSIPIVEDKSNYWFPLLYWQKNDGSFISVNGSAVIYYLFGTTPNYTIPFLDDFRMISGDPTLRTLDPSSFAQQAITFLCLDFSGTSSKFNELPVKMSCPDGIRAQINFPSCWDGTNTDSPDHKSHVAFLSTGPDNGTCNDPDFPMTLPRIFLEVYWNTNIFESQRDQAMSPHQPFVFSYGDPTGYGYHADFVNGWDEGVLQRAIDQCNCNPYGDPTCCAAQGTFTIQQTTQCFITNTFDEAVTGNLSTLPGANPVQDSSCYEQYVDTVVPPIISPVFVYTSTAGATPTIPTGTIATPAQTTQVAPTKAAGTCLRTSDGSALGPLGRLWWIISMAIPLFILH